jgi:hypothetical protein
VSRGKPRNYNQRFVPVQQVLCSRSLDINNTIIQQAAICYHCSNVPEIMLICSSPQEKVLERSGIYVEMWGQVEIYDP